MLSRIAFVLLVFLVLPAPAHAQREGCWPNGAGGFQCSSNCRVTACNDYYDRYGQIRKKCRFQCARQQPQAFAPQHSNQRVTPRAVPPRPSSAVANTRQSLPISPYASFHSAIWAMSPAIHYGFVALCAGFLFVARMGYFDLAPEERPYIAGMFGHLAFVSLLTLANYLELSSLAKSEWRGDFLGRWLIWFAPFVAYLLIRFSKRFLMGWHYVFVAHPAAPAVNTAVAQNSALDFSQLKSALTPTAEELTGKPRKWAFQYRTDAAKARALQEKLDADAAIARAAVERERARRARRDN